MFSFPLLLSTALIVSLTWWSRSRTPTGKGLRRAMWMTSSVLASFHILKGIWPAPLFKIKIVLLVPNFTPYHSLTILVPTLKKKNIGRNNSSSIQLRKIVPNLALKNLICILYLFLPQKGLLVNAIITRNLTNANLLSSTGLDTNSSILSYNVISCSSGTCSTNSSSNSSTTSTVIVAKSLGATLNNFTHFVNIPSTNNVPRCGSQFGNRTCANNFCCSPYGKDLLSVTLNFQE